MIKILIIEHSYIIRKGMLNILNNLRINFEIQELSSTEHLEHNLDNFAPNIIIINTIISSSPEISALLQGIKDTRIIYLCNSPMTNDNDKSLISIFDSKPNLLKKLESNIKSKSAVKEEQDSSQELSDRECDVLKEIALGRTNKEIANNLFISTHTVISHRKNITRKLGIKTVSGLTVYALLNQIITSDEVS